MSQLLREIAEIGAGQGAPQGDSSYCSDGIPFVKAGNMESLTSGGSLNDIQKVAEDVAKTHKLKLYPKGTILFAKSGMSCLKGYVYVLPQEAYVVSHLACITPKEDISEYLRYYFRYHKPNQLVKDAAYPSISLADIGALEIDTKDEAARNHIINSLRSVEGIIKLRYKELQYLDELIKARFVEMFATEENLMPLSELCLIITDGTHQPPKFKSEGIPFIFVSNITKDKVTYEAEKFIDHDTYDELIKRTPIEIGDVLLSTVGSYGHPAVVKSDKKFLFQRHIAYLKPKREIIDSDYLHGAILSPAAQEQIEKGVKGIAQKTLNLSEIKKMTIPVPPMEDQKQFAAFKEQVDKSKVAVQKALDVTRVLFDSLMQEYFG